MDYQRHYDALMIRGKSRELSGYKESHHIIPRCMGGSDDKDNLVDLTPEEHFVAHQLLAKIYPKNHSLIYAVKILMGSKNYSNKQFGWVRKRAVEASIKFHTGRKRSDETKEKISASLKGKIRGPISEEHRINLSKSHKGKIFTETHKKNISNRVITEEWRNKLSIANSCRTLENHSDKIKAGITEESKRKISEAVKNSPLKKCQHCGKECRGSNFTRWHGDNCKMRGTYGL